jgi:hypothetical protein
MSTLRDILLALIGALVSPVLIVLEICLWIYKKISNKNRK